MSTGGKQRYGFATYRVNNYDFRAQIDCVMIDSNYDGKVFRITEQDIPYKKDDFIKARYSIKIPHDKAHVAVKIIDMLGEEVIERLKIK